MARAPRHSIIDESEVGVYHIVSRCVRRSFLMGVNAQTGIDCSHRREWVVAGLAFLAQHYAIDALSFATLSNHYHIVLRNRVDIAQSWCEEEVAIRWWRQTSDGAREGLNAIPKPSVLSMMLSDSSRMAELRRRLSSPSWFMKHLNQKIARMGNDEDGSRGHFFMERFWSKRLTQLSQAIACTLYIDLNEMRARIASGPEDSFHSSAIRRVARMLKRERLLIAGDIEQAEYYAEDDPDIWLAPIHEAGSAPPLSEIVFPAGYDLGVHDERIEEVQSTKDSGRGEDVACQAAGEKVANKQGPRDERREAKSKPSKKRAKFIRQRRRHGFLPMTVDAYVELLDAVGRQVVESKRGSIAADLPPIMERLRLDHIESTASALGRLFDRHAHLEAGPVDVPPSSPGDPTGHT